MTKTPKAAADQGILVPAIEEMPRISDAEREELRASLDKAREEIKSGRYDVVTPELLREEFDAIFYDNKSDAEIDAGLAKASTRQADKS